ncbi:hypothetical protein O1L60_43135 [Streptomyces diastatochromogenes]|nr:hypothetical protein [Streptomyces diastatochromogenes]
MIALFSFLAGGRTPTAAPPSVVASSDSSEPSTAPPNRTTPPAKSPTASTTPSLPAPGSAVPLASLTPISEEDETLNVGPQTVNLENHPVTMYSECSYTTWQLNRKYASFTVRYGVTDDFPGDFPGEFSIQVDGTEKATAEKGVGVSAGTFTVDVSNAFRMTLRSQPCRNPAVGQLVWIDPVLTVK